MNPKSQQPRRGSRYSERRPASANDRLTLVIDTAEQLAYEFAPEEVAVARYAIPVGDYSIAGLETSFAIERKSIDDLFSTVISDRARFEAEIARARGYRFFGILVEATFREVLEYTSPHAVGISDAQRAARPKTVVNSLNTYAARQGVQLLYVDRDRDLCRALVLRLAERFWREHGPHAAQEPAQAPESAGAA